MCDPGATTAVLQNTWTVWTSQWSGKPEVTLLRTFDTVHGFVESCKEAPLSHLADRCYLHIFKEGIPPMWEDPANADGGHLKLLTKSQEASLALWHALTQAMVKGQLPTHEQVLCQTSAQCFCHQRWWRWENWVGNGWPAGGRAPLNNSAPLGGLGLGGPTPPIHPLWTPPTHPPHTTHPAP